MKSFIRRYAADAALLLALLLVNGLFLAWSAFRFFDFYDMGAFLDLGWRIAAGQKPYVDFLLTITPVHAYMLALFFILFGFGKAAILAHLICVSSVVIGLCYGICRLCLKRTDALLNGTLTMTSFYWAWSHPWYTVNANFWGILAVFLMMIGCARDRDNDNPWWIPFGAGFLSLLAAMTKQNVGACYVLFASAFFLLGRRPARSVILFLAGLTVGFVCVWALMIPSISDFYTQVFRYTSFYQDRLNALSHGPHWLFGYHWLLGLFLLPYLGVLWKEHRGLIILFLGLWFTGVANAYTNGSTLACKWQTVGPAAMTVAISLALLTKTPRKGRHLNRWMRWLLRIVVIFLIALNAGYGYNLSAWPYSPGHPSFYRKIRVPPMRGWEGPGPRVGALNRLVDYVNGHIPEQDSLLILTDMQILNAATGRKPLPQIPWAWHVGQVPAPGKDLNKIKKYLKTNPPDWILIHITPTMFLVDNIVPYLDLAPAIQYDYFYAESFGNYALFVRKANIRRPAV